MNTGTLYMLHDAGYEYIVAVTNSVYLQFLTLNIFINQNRLILVNRYSCFQIGSQLIFIRNNLHSTSAQNIGGAHQNRIADFCRSLYACLNIGNSLSLGLRDVQLIHDMLKGVSVFCLFNCRNICTDDGYAAFHQRLCKVDGSLPAEGRNYTQRLL